MGKTAPLLLVAVIVAATYLTWRHYANAKALLQDWANANKLRVLQAKSNAV
jgi:hypothetical protein